MFPETITSHTELFVLLETIRDYEKTLADAIRKGILTRAGIEHVEEIIIEKKRAARDFLRRERERHDDLPHLVHNEGDSYIVLVPLPRSLTDAETAEAWFMDHEYLHYRESQWDCTGQLFTSWYRIINRNGCFFAYHSVSMDV